MLINVKNIGEPKYEDMEDIEEMPAGIEFEEQDNEEETVRQNEAKKIRDYVAKVNFIVLLIIKLVDCYLFH